MMSFKKLTLTLHLWLGLSSGLVVFIVGITGCMLAFQQEIEAVTKPWLFVSGNGHQQLAPSQLETNLAKQLKAAGDTGKARIGSLNYPGSSRSAILSYSTGPKKFYRAYLDPYTGKVIRYNQPTVDFFDFIEHGHRWLWFPFQIGRPIQGSFVLVFLFMMISGVILWWPKRWNKRERLKSLTINRKAGFKRFNYDLHNVLGFYMTWMMLLIVITGLCISMPWFQGGFYWLTSGGKTTEQFKQPLSDTTGSLTPLTLTRLDSIWQIHYKELKQEAGFFYILPGTKKLPVLEIINLAPGTSYNRIFHYYDQYSLKDISDRGSFKGTYATSTTADKLRRLNIDIHMGVVGGLFTKILAFIASLIAASLPITGFLIWWGKRKKQIKKLNQSYEKVNPKPFNGAKYRCSFRPFPVDRNQ